MQDKDNSQTISRAEVKELHEIACPAWKNIFMAKATKNPFESIITFTEDEVIKMFEAATPAQLPLVEKLFIKPKPKYRPYDDIGEGITALKGKWVIRKETHTLNLVVGICKTCAYIANFNKPISYSDLLKEFKFEDGSPCGVLVV